MRLGCIQTPCHFCKCSSAEKLATVLEITARPNIAQKTNIEETKVTITTFGTLYNLGLLFFSLCNLSQSLWEGKLHVLTHFLGLSG